MHYVFCISGFSGVGKDEFCHRLVEKHAAVHTGLADPAKRHMADVYGFSRNQLFGPSAMRNAGDPRYPKTRLTKLLGGRPAEHSELLLNTGEDHYTDPGKHWWMADVTPQQASDANLTVVYGGGSSVVMDGARILVSQHLGPNRTRVFVEDTDPRFFLSPREALQLYCDLMNQMYECTWVRAGIEVHKQLALTQSGRYKYVYDRMIGLVPNDGSRQSQSFQRSDLCSCFLQPCAITCFSDFRHWHEIRYVRQAQRESFRAVMVRVKRPGIEEPPYNHRSETEQATIPDSEFDYVVDNNDTVEQLHAIVDTIVNQVKGA